MVSATNLFAILLAAGASFTFALPTEQLNDIAARNITLIDIADSGTLTIKVGTEAKAAKCPATNNGPNRNYDAKSYTKGQVKAAMLSGAQYGAADKTIGANNYPHFFDNQEALPFDCGKNKQEWPIRTDGKVWAGEDVTNIPDRVVYEFKESGDDYIISYCGVMRHGPNRPFLKCT